MAERRWQAVEYGLFLCPFLWIAIVGCPRPSSQQQQESEQQGFPGTAEVHEAPGYVAAGYVEIQGLRAGDFIPSYWQKNTLNWVADVRAPIFAARATGTYQNIYAPWPLEQPNGWRVFYGGWDGHDVPFDQIYSTTTSDFLNFGARDHIIANGAFFNVNNVNVQQVTDGSLHMICTGGQPGNAGGDKPLYFSSPDGSTFNGSAEPYPAQLSDIISIQGYAGFSTGNFNGANVLLRDNDLCDNAEDSQDVGNFGEALKHVAPGRKRL